MLQVDIEYESSFIHQLRTSSGVVCTNKTNSSRKENQDATKKNLQNEYRCIRDIWLSCFCTFLPHCPEGSIVSVLQNKSKPKNEIETKH